MSNKLIYLATIALLLVGCAPTQAAPSKTIIRLFTHNLHAEEQILDPFVDNLQAADADIVALQEVSPAAAAHFAAVLGDVYPYRAEALAAGRYNGLLVLSRYPIQTSETWPSPRRLLRVQLDITGTSLTLYNVHPCSPANDGFAARDADIHFVLEHAAQSDKPVALLGDFNLEPWAKVYDEITASHTDAFAAVGEGSGFTYPDYSQSQAQASARLPQLTPLLLRLDYIF